MRVTKARYFRFIDQKRWDEFPSLFVADVHVDVTDDMRLCRSRPEPRHHRRARTSSRATSAARSTASTPCTTATCRRSTSSTTTHATAITAMFDRLQFADGRVQVGYGHYDEEYRLDDGAWRIARTDLAPPARRRRALSHVPSGYSDFRAMPTSARAAVSSRCPCFGASIGISNVTSCSVPVNGNGGA